VNRFFGHSFKEWEIVQAAGVTLDSISSGEIDTRHRVGEQGALAVVAAEVCSDNMDGK